jgi:hypothetical protein
MSVTARQSTARTIMVGPVLDSAGAAVTGAVVGDFKISKNGAAPAALNGSATLTHRHTGHYSLALTATDTDTVGSAQITLDKTTDTCPEKDITIVEEVIYDAIWVASANTFTGAAGATTLTALADGSITAAKIAADAITAAKIATDAITAAKIATGAITSSKFATDAIDSDALAASAVSEIQSGLSTLTQTQVSGGAYALNSASFAFNSALDLTTTQKASVNTEADTALSDYGALKPTTAGRTLDVAATGEAGLDFNNVLSSSLLTLHSLTITGNTTFTGTTAHTGHVSYANGIEIAAPSTANRPGLKITGNGNGEGLFIQSGDGASVYAVHLSSIGQTGEALYLRTVDGHGLAGTIAGSGKVLLSGAATLSALTVSGATTFTGAITGSNASNSINLGTDSIGSTQLAASAVSEIQSGLSTLDAAGIRTAVGLASANLDTQLDALPTAAENAAAVLASTIETGKSLTQCIRAIAAVAAGKRSNAGTSTEQYDAIGNAGTARVIGNMDAAGDGTPTLSL